MYRTTYLLLVFVIAFASCSSPTKEENSTEKEQKPKANLNELPLQEIFLAINTEVLANSEAYAQLDKITSTIGHRLTGTENGTKAEQFAYDLFKSYGFDNTEFHEFEAISWMRESVSLTISRETWADIEPEVVSLAHSPELVDTTAELIDAGNGLRANFEELRDQIKGKIVLMNLGIDPPDESLSNLHRSEKTALAIEFGAAGVILINSVEGGVLLTGTASVTGDLITIPAICISKEAGAEVRERLMRPSTNPHPHTAHLTMKNVSTLIKARNVIATIEGTEKPDEYIVIGGHLDSWDLASGAIDNGIGSFSIIDIARTFKVLGLTPKRSIKFVMFMGEEEGLLGSKALVEDWIKQEKLDQVKCMFNLDMAGNPIGFNTSGRDEMQPVVDSIGQMIATIDTIYKNSNPNRPGLHSDHQSFMMEGIPVMGPKSNMDHGIYGCYHSSCDDFELVEAKDMVNNVRFTGMMLYGIANMDVIPAKRMTSEETGQFLTDANLKEKLILGKSWRWDL
jgi:carboxypeptidase Q